MRESRREESLEQKLLEVCRLQHLNAQVSRFRQIQSQEPWDLMSRVVERVDVVNGEIAPRKEQDSLTSSQTWYRPVRPWVFGK